MCAASLLAVDFARGERLPISEFTASDGLASDAVECIVRDSRGFLWFCHPGQLSRFDGQRFSTYGARHGLPQGSIRTLLETRRGAYLLATSEGVYRYEPDSGPRLFVPADSDEKQPPSVYTLLEDRAGRVWAGASKGLFVLEPDGPRLRHRRFDLDVAEGYGARVFALLETRDGVLWIGTKEGLVRRSPDGRLKRFRMRDGLPGDDIRCLLEDREGRVWVGTTSGLARLADSPSEQASVALDVFLPGRDLPVRVVTAIHQGGDGVLWIGSQGVGALQPGAAAAGRVRWYTASNGLTGEQITCFAEDAAGNLWIGTEAGGAMRVTRDGFISFGEADGLVKPRINSIFEDRAGQLHVAAPGYTHQLAGDHFVATRLPVSLEDEGWGWHQWVFQDRAGAWWIPTRRGALRFDGIGRAADLARARPSAVYVGEIGRTDGSVFRLFEDSKGDVWIGTIGGELKVRLARWQRRTGEVRWFTAADGLPTAAPTAFREDSNGGLWIGFYLGGVGRFLNGRFEFFPPSAGLPPGLVRSLHLDRRGHLWIATEGGGAARIDDPAAARPTFTPYSVANGLASNAVTAITEDGQGRIYFGLDRGVDRLTPDSGVVEHFTTADGLPNSFVTVAFRDRRGDLWFGTLGGAARLAPDAARRSTPPPVFIERVRIAGAPHSVSDLGETEVPEVKLPHDANRVQIEFGGVDFEPGGNLRFQYRLESAENEWSEPQAGRSVDFANLSSGAYRFLVRGVNAAGQPSLKPASFSFVVLPPFWLSGWFVTLAALLAAGVALGVHRARLARAVALERIRTRIASDLHDDIGASLSRIAIQSELLRRRSDDKDTEGKDALARIADGSRELVDSMGDIVWAINPKRDQLGDVVQRMRRFLSDAVSAADIEFSFEAPGHGREIRLGADLRRQAYLVLKEGVNNALRHSGCSRIDVVLDVTSTLLTLEIRDDGSGFDTARPSDGNGLVSMRRRAAEVGGELCVDSTPGRGTRILFTAPLRRRLRFRLGMT